MRDGGLYPLFQKHIKEFHWQRIEPTSATAGMPDCNYCFEGTEGWLELKQEKNGKIDLRPVQIGWILDRARHGGLIRIAVRVSFIPMMPEEDLLIIYDGALVRDYYKRKITDNETMKFAINFWRGGPKSWDWNEIKQSLIQR